MLGGTRGEKSVQMHLFNNYAEALSSKEPFITIWRPRGVEQIGLHLSLTKLAHKKNIEFDGGRGSQGWLAAVLNPNPQSS